MNTESQNLPRALRSRVQEITIHTDSRDILAAAVKDQKQFGMKDYFIVDVDSHHVETDSWDEVLAHIDDPVLRYNGQSIAANWPIARKLALHNEVPGLMFQDCQGRIPHQATLAEAVEETDVHRDVTLIRRGMESMASICRSFFRSRCSRSASIRTRRSPPNSCWPTIVGS